ncbi:MAG: hypothetical protein QM731_14715 [Chitinophagaceae bacterium]
MKKKIRKWSFRLLVTVLVIAGMLLLIILNPVLTYANKTQHDNFTVYHSEAINPALYKALDEAGAFLKTSELYNPRLKLDICLNDGAAYPKLMRTLRGPAFAWGFYNKVVMQGTADYNGNYVELNGYKWNLSQLLAHEMTHCLQFDRLGFWKSKPVAAVPEWKWEGYAEYISRRSVEQQDLKVNIKRLSNADKTDPTGWAIAFSDNTIAPREYYNYWLLVQYCMNVKKMNYEQVLKDTTREAILKQEMLTWYNSPHH